MSYGEAVGDNRIVEAALIDPRPPEGKRCSGCPESLIPPCLAKLAVKLELRREPEDCPGPQPASALPPGALAPMPSEAVILEFSGGIVAAPSTVWTMGQVCGRYVTMPNK